MRELNVHRCIRLLKSFTGRKALKISALKGISFRLRIGEKAIKMLFFWWELPFKDIYDFSILCFITVVYRFLRRELEKYNEGNPPISMMAPNCFKSWLFVLSLAGTYLDQQLIRFNFLLALLSSCIQRCLRFCIAVEDPRAT